MEQLKFLLKPYQPQINNEGEIKIECNNFTLQGLEKQHYFQYYHMKESYYFIYNENGITIITTALIFYIKNGQGVLYTSSNNLCHKFNFNQKEYKIDISLVELMLEYINLFKINKSYNINICDKTIAITSDSAKIICNYFNEHLKIQINNIIFTFDNYPNPTLEIVENAHKILINFTYESDVINLKLSIKSLNNINNILTYYYDYYDKQLNNYRYSYNIINKNLLFYEENNVLAVIFRDRLPILKVIFHEKDDCFVPKRKIMQNKQITTFNNVNYDNLQFTSFNNLINNIANKVKLYYIALHDL